MLLSVRASHASFCSALFFMRAHHARAFALPHFETAGLAFVASIIELRAALVSASDAYRGFRTGRDFRLCRRGMAGQGHSLEGSVFVFGRCGRIASSRAR